MKRTRPNLKPYFVYLLFDIECVPKYVGFSRYKHRLGRHEKDQGGPRLKIMEGLCLEEAERFEANLIAAIGRQEDGGPLLNKATHAHSGWKHTEEGKARISAKHKGRVFTEEHKARISASRLGKKLSPEHRAKIGAGLKGKMKGKPLTETHKANLSASRKGEKRGPFSEEHRRKLSERQTASWASGSRKGRGL